MLNQVILIGRLVKKPELRESENGKNYLKATLAVQSDYRKKDGEYETDFLEFTAFGKVAENTAKYCDKGSLLNVIGTLSKNVYKDKNGVNHYQMSVIATKISFLSKGNKKEEKQIEDVFVLGQ